MLVRIVNAFVTDDPGTGNPAGVVLLENDEATTDEQLKAVAKAARDYDEREQPWETAFAAFAWPDESTGQGEYKLRWFYPDGEVNICGHATLATSHVLFDHNPHLNELAFETKRVSRLAARRAADGLVELSFPADQHVTPLPTKEADIIKKAWLKAAPQLQDGEIVATLYDMTGCIMHVELPVGLALRDLQVDQQHLMGLAAVIENGPWNEGKPKQAQYSQLKITTRAPAGSGYDWHSRVFVPDDGSGEDYVTGSAHCSLAPYWKSLPDATSRDTRARPFKALQASQRTGQLQIVLEGNRCLLRGKAQAVHQFSMGDYKSL